MTTRRARRTTRSAGLVAVAAAAALALTACQSAGSDAASGTGKKDSVSTAHLATGKSDARSTSEISGGGSAADARVASSKAVSSVRKQTLVDGSTAEIRRISAQHYRAKIVNEGDVLATLDANGDDAGLDANGMFIVLTMDGKVQSWMGGAHSGPGTFKLAGGWKAKVTQLGDLHYRADILGLDGSVMGTLEANEHDDGAVANGIYLVLSAGGVISSHE
ncbi:hypothetical protein [Streptomyces sp. DSM 118878]